MMSVQESLIQDIRLHVNEGVILSENGRTVGSQSLEDAECLAEG